jgi:SET domain-containing protein
LRDISAGEELSFNYGFDLETWEDHPCRCGHPQCVGYIIDQQYWPELKRILKKREAERIAREAKISRLEARAEVLKKQLEAMSPKKSVGKKKTGKKR